MLTETEKYKLFILSTEKCLHETEMCSVELVISSLDGHRYVKRSYHEDKRELFSVLKNIDSPFIPKIYDVFFDSDTIVIEEYANGERLDKIAERGAMTERELERLGDELLLAVKVLHQNGIIHRDIKPENIIVGEHGIKLIDYGIARLYRENEEHDTSQLGTQGYAAPEQYGFGQSGPRTDIFAFGKTIQTAVSGCGGCRALKAAAARCAKFDPQSRFSDAEEVRRFIKRRKLLPAFGLCGLVVVSAALFYLFFAPTHAPKQTVPAPAAIEKDVSAILPEDKKEEKAQEAKAKAVPAPEPTGALSKSKKEVFPSEPKPENKPASVANGGLIMGADDERVVIQTDNNYCPALLLNDTYGRSAKHAKMSLGGSMVRTEASMTGDTLTLLLSDEQGHSAEYTFRYSAPNEADSSGKMSYYGEVLFFDLDDDGIQEIFTVLAKRRKVFDKNTKRAVIYKIEQNIGWCISYDPKTGFTLHKNSIRSEIPFSANQRIGGMPHSIFGDISGFNPGFVLMSGEFTDINNYKNPD